MPHLDEVPGIRLVVHSRVRFRLAPKNCLMRVLRTGGTIDEFLEQSLLVFLDQREGFYNYDDGDSEITPESTTTFQSRQNAFIVVFLIFVRKFSTYF